MLKDFESASPEDLAIRESWKTRIHAVRDVMPPMPMYSRATGGPVKIPAVEIKRSPGVYPDEIIIVMDPGVFRGSIFTPHEEKGAFLFLLREEELQEVSPTEYRVLAPELEVQIEELEYQQNLTR